VKVQTNGMQYTVPQGICVSCGGGPVVAQLKKQASSRHVRLSAAFPLCQKCNETLIRVEAAWRPVKRRSRLLAIPLAAAICVVYVLVSGDVPAGAFMTDSAWMHYLFLFVAGWFVSYALILAFRHLGSGVADPQDRAADRAIKSSVKVSVLDIGRTMFTFSNPVYGSLFKMSNPGSLAPS
jgi:hypothetical protein